MAVQNFGLACFVFTLVISTTYSSPISPVRSYEEGSSARDGDEVWGSVFSLETPAQREDRVLEADKDGPRSSDDEVTAMPYVDASVFRQTVATPKPDKLKPKGSVIAKKAFSGYDKYAKEQNEIKHMAAQEEEEEEEEKKSSSEERKSDEGVDDTIASILGALHVEIFDSDQENASVTPTIASTTVATTTTTTKGTTEVSTTSTEATTRTNEDSELPRLSPPIWLHSSAAEALSDPLRLPMIETFDRDDRYSHSIARDVFW